MGKMMKNVLNKLVRDEEGQAFILVLIFLLVGGLIIAPLLGFMGTGLKVGQMHEQKMEGLYAADAGVEDALYKIMKNDELLPVVLGEKWEYPLEDEIGDLIYINGNSVHVEILMEENTDTFLSELLDSDAGVHEAWTAVEDPTADGKNTITVTYDGAAMNKRINGVGAWFRGTTWYCTDDSFGDILVPPLIDMTDDALYPVYSFETKEYKGGIAFIWTWTGANRPVFQPGVTRTQTFKFEPEKEVVLHIAWVHVGSEDIGAVPTSVTFGNYTVTATATDSTTGSQTQVVAYPSWQGSGGPNAVDILAWEINPQ